MYLVGRKPWFNNSGACTRQARGNDTFHISRCDGALWRHWTKVDQSNCKSICQQPRANLVEVASMVYAVLVRHDLLHCQRHVRLCKKLPMHLRLASQPQPRQSGVTGLPPVSTNVCIVGPCTGNSQRHPIQQLLLTSRVSTLQRRLTAHCACVA